MLYLLFLPLIFFILHFRIKRLRSAIRRRDAQTKWVEIGLIGIVSVLSLFLLMQSKLLL
jgi:hypothetical protein